MQHRGRAVGLLAGSLTRFTFWSGRNIISVINLEFRPGRMATMVRGSEINDGGWGRGGCGRLRFHAVSHDP